MLGASFYWMVVDNWA